MPAPTIDQTIVKESRRLMAAILSHRDRTGEWPWAAEVFVTDAYKSAKRKHDAANFAKGQGWLEVVEFGSNANSGAPKLQYCATEAARQALALPDPLPPLRTGMSAFPDDPCEDAIYSFHLSFHNRYGRWPIGSERNAAFSGRQTRLISKYRRAEAYQNLVRDGRLVEIRIKSIGREVSCFVIPRESPEYADKHNWLFYAKSIPT